MTRLSVALLVGAVLALLLMSALPAYGEEAIEPYAVDPYLTILDTDVTDANKDNVTGPGISGSISYDPDSKTLTLENATIVGGGAVTSRYAIVANEDIAINLIGQNRIGNVPSDPTNAADYDIAVGITSPVGVFVYGSGGLTIYDEDTGIFGADFVEINGVGGKIVIVERGNTDIACCLKSDDTVRIYGSDVELTSQYSNGVKAPIIIIGDSRVEVQAYNRGGISNYAYSTMPQLVSVPASIVTAGADAATAVVVPHPIDTTFTASPYVLIEPVQGFQVTVINGAGSGTYAAGATVTINANEDPVGKVFDKWVTSDPGVVFADANAPHTTFVMPAHDVTVTATYKDAIPATGDTMSLLGIVSLVSILGLGFELTRRFK